MRNVEIREISVAVPTYKRPDLLHRSLVSLQAQSYSHWRAFVFDDSPTGEGLDVVRAVRDRRIHYEKNADRMGAAANIDQCFSGRLPRSNGWGYVLEDDNFLLPAFFEHVFEVMSGTGAELALFNQRIAQANGILMPAEHTTRGGWFLNGWVEPQELHAKLLLMEGLSNGGLVWRTGGSVRLFVGSQVKFTALHEACRSLLIQKRFWFSDTALTVWTDFPREHSARAQESNRSVARGLQSITGAILARYGDSAVERAMLVARDRLCTGQLVKRLLHAGAPCHSWSVDPRETLGNLQLFFRGMACRVAVADPCDGFLRDLEAATERLRS